ncbi:MAG: aldo/keto reductase [Pseudomonadota bacterium]
MQAIQLGTSDLTVSPLAWGCWRLDDRTPIADILDTLAANQINFIDTAAIYGYGSDYGAGLAEKLLGDALRDHSSRREDWVIASKGGLDLPVPYNSTREFLIRDCEASLQRLQIEALDLYMIHRPDLLTPLAEVAETLDHLVASGKTRYVGVSNFTQTQVNALAAHVSVPLQVNQVEFSAKHMAPLLDGTLEQCQAMSMTPMAWSPLGGGALLKRITDKDPRHIWRLITALNRIGHAHECERSQVALAFVRQYPGVIPVIGSQQPARILEAVAACDIELTRREWYEIVEARTGEPMP